MSITAADVRAWIGAYANAIGEHRAGERAAFSVKYL